MNGWQALNPSSSPPPPDGCPPPFGNGGPHLVVGGELLEGPQQGGAGVAAHGEAAHVENDHKGVGPERAGRRASVLRVYNTPKNDLVMICVNATQKKNGIFALSGTILGP